MEFRDFQLSAAELWAGAAEGERRLLAAPTGVGKSYCAIAMQQRRDCTIAVPSPAIAKQLQQKGAKNVTTIGKLLSKVRDGFRPERLIVDEAHHSTADTWEEVANASGMTWGLTATPYRGTAKGTAALHDLYGDPIWLVTLPRAAAEGWIHVPEFDLRTLIPDTGKVRAGDFVGAAKAVDLCFESIIDDIKKTRCGSKTLVVMPSSGLAKRAAEALGCGYVLAGTGEKQREKSFAGDMLTTVNVVSEGVDLPIDEMFVARPTASAVRAMQLWGRATRVPSRIVEYTRNFERFSFLWEGLMPDSTISAAQAIGMERFGSYATARDRGFEIASRIKPVNIPLLNGIVAPAYAVYSTKEKTSYFCIADPWRNKWRCSFRPHQRARWKKCGLPVDLVGYSSYSEDAITDKQWAWWKRSAKCVGLDPDVVPDSKQFQALPALLESRQYVRRPT